MASHRAGPGEPDGRNAVRHRLVHEGRLVLRIAVVWIITAGMAVLLADVLDGFVVDNIGDAFSAAAAVAALNALVWPIFMRLALGAVVLTLGLGVFLLNGVLVSIVMEAVPGVRLSGIPTSVVVGLVLTATTAFAAGLMSIDDDHFYQRFIIGRARRRRFRADCDTLPGVLFLQVDGLGYDTVRRAVRDGDAPVLARWLAEGSHTLAQWDTDWTSQTGASQAGILHGDNDDMPAFRWYEKDLERLLVSNRASSAAEIERRKSNGRGLLHHDGASRGNLFTGDAPISSLTLSVAGRRKGRLGAGYYGYLANPYNAARTFFAFFAEIAREIAQSTTQRRLDIRPRVPRGGAYPVLRALATTVTRDVTVQAVLEDMMAGRTVVYANFTGYDEVAHHSGIERYDSLAVLRGIDRQIGRLATAAALAPRPYELVVLSDHGQSQSLSFQDEYDETLQEVVRNACHLRSTVRRERRAGAETRGLTGVSLARAASGEGPVARALRRVTHAHLVSGEAMLGEAATREAADQVERRRDVLALDSGSLGLVYLIRVPGRATLEQIQSVFPELLPRLVDHPGVGFVLVRSGERGPIVLGRNGIRYLAEDHVDGTDPLADFGPHAVRRLLRTDSFDHAADLMINGAYDSQTDLVTCFERFVGSHGGMGGPQTRAFVLYPARFGPLEPVFGAAQLHHVLRGWLVEVGHTAYLDKSEDPAELHAQTAGELLD